MIERHTLAVCSATQDVLGRAHSGIAPATAVPGAIDFMSLRDRTAIRIATAHMLLNITILLLFVANIGLRTRGYDPTGAPFALSVVAVALLLVSGWLGWELIYRQGVGLSPEIEVRVKARRGAA